MNKSVLITIKFLLPLILSFLALEFYVEFLEKDRETWFSWLEKYQQNNKVDCIFIGSSMTLAAIVPAEFDAEILRLSGRKLNSKNMGMCYSTPAEYYFGLRYLLKNNSTALSQRVVFIEAPGEIPAFATWKDDWMEQQAPRLLAVYVNFGDIWRYWTSSRAPLLEKVLLPVSKFSYAAAYAPLIQEALFTGINKFAAREIFKKEADPPESDLVNLGGIRTDQEGVRLVRNWVYRFAEKRCQNQKAINWDETVICDLVQLIAKNGGKVVFFKMPLSSAMSRPYATSIRELDKKHFKEKLSKWHSVMLNPNFVISGDEDFPDLLHLRKSRAQEMSRALAESYALEISRALAEPNAPELKQPAPAQ